jgi:1-acyl-sn-glycerol-3-phosphate acyltransferase|tara:strand:- start:101 stop:694 length:594 start_codon:yes stop_codon:yes gene_type:complete
MTRAFARTMFASIGTDIEIHNRDKRIHQGGAIVAANHTSYLDPPIVACAYNSAIAFLARKSLFHRFGAWLYPRLNAFPIDRDHADLQSMRTILRKLKDDERILMFPEGTRSADGRLQKAKAGIGMLVVKSGVPVQPVRIFGAHESWPKGGKFRPHRIQVVIGDPVEFDPGDLKEKSREAYQRIADQLMAAIAELKVE